MQLLEMCEAPAFNLLFLSFFFFFSIFNALTFRTDQFVNVTTQTPKMGKTGQTHFFGAILSLLQSNSPLHN